MKTNRSLMKLGPIMLMVASRTATADVFWNITDLGTFEGYQAEARAINDLGQVAIISDRVVAIEDVARFGFIWEDGASPILLDIPSYPDGRLSSNEQGNDGYITTINNAGQVAGSFVDSEFADHAFVWQNSNLNDLGTFGGTNARAIGSNGSGQVWANYTEIVVEGADVPHGVLLQNGETSVDFGADSQIYWVNSLGQALVRQYNVESKVDEYFLFQKDPVTGEESRESVIDANNIVPQELNNAKQIVGYVSGEGGELPFLLQNGDLSPNILQTLGVTNQSHAYSINNAGQIVGFENIPNVGMHALFWNGNDVEGNPIDLNDDNYSNASSNQLILGQAFSINNLGQIVGEAYVGEATHAFLANPSGTLNWMTSGDGAWDDSANWELGFLPNRFLDVVIGNIYFPGPAPDVTVTGPSGDSTVNSLTVGGGTSARVLDLSNGGNLTVINGVLVSGPNGSDQISQSTGTTTANSLTLGQNIGSSGTYILSGNGSFTADNEIVGYAGNGVFNQTGGTHTVNGTLTLALEAASTGTYNLSGSGTLNTLNEYVGSSGTANFNQTGGTHNVTGTLTINSNSNYQLSDGELNAANLINQGNFTQSGGVSSGNFSNESIVNYNGGTFNANLTNTGTVNLSGIGTRIFGGAITNQGNFNITDTVAQITGTFNNETGGSLTGSEIRNEGTFNYSGGDYGVSTLTNTGTVNLSGTGTRVLSGNITNQGDFNITDTVAQITGTFHNETGGSVTGSQIQNDGTINYSAGSFDANLINSGTINLTGGGTRSLGGSITNQGNIVTTDTIAQFAGSFNNVIGGNVTGTEIQNTGIFNYSGGNVSFNSLLNSGTFNLDVSDPVLDRTVTNQGQFNIAGAVAEFTSTFNNVSGGNVNGGLILNSGTFNNSGNNFNANLTSTGTVNLSGTGTRVFNGDVTNQGTFNVIETNVVYTGNFDNQGVYFSDPSVNTFDNLNVGSDGYLVGGAGDQFIVQGNFTNSSTQNINWDTTESTLIFDNANGPATHLMSLASADLGSAITAFDNNFAWGEVVLESGQRLTLVDGNRTPGAALYASQLTLPNGVSQLNSVSGDYNIYYDPAIAANQYLAGSVFNFGSGIGQLIPQGFSFLGTDPTAEGFTLNESSYAQALNTACLQATGALAQRCRELRVLTPNQRANAIASSTPTQQMAQIVAPIKFNFARMEAPMVRMMQLRRKQTQASTLSFNGFQIPINLSVAALGLNARGGGAGDDQAFADSFRDEPFGLFIDGKFTVGNQRENPNNFGFDIDSRAVTVGADYRFTDNLVAGVAMEYMNVNTTFNNFAGTMDSDTFMGAVYGSYRLPEDFYVDAIATYGSSEHALTRTFGYPGFSGNATSKPGADQYTFAVTLGKDFAWQEWQLSPYTRFEYLQMHVDSYQENGGGGLAVNVGSQSNTSAISTLGTQVSYNLSQSWGILVPSAWVEWEHQYLDNNERIPMRLSAAAAGTGDFVIQTGQPDRDYVNLGGSLSASLPEGKSAFIRYEARLGQTDISNHIVEVGVRIPF